MKKTACTALLALILSTWLYAASAQAEDAQSRQPLRLYVFVHDDIPEATRKTLHRDYLSWFQKDLGDITGRQVALELLEQVPAISNFNYKQDNNDLILREWSYTIMDYARAHNLALDSRTKYLLLTKDRLNTTTLGIAGLKHYAGIASLVTYIAPAHEFGHMFGAGHEHAETLFSKGWPCGTNMSENSNPSQLKANCYVFSKKNQQAIRAYLSEVH